MERRCKRVPFCRESLWNCPHQSFEKNIHPTLLRRRSPGLKALSSGTTENLKYFSGRRVSFCISGKAGMTVEAALALPVFLFAVLALINLMQVCRLQGMLNMSLQDSARMMGTYGYVMPGEEGNAEFLLGTGACILYAQSQLPDEIREAGTVSFWKSTYQDHRIRLQADYRIRAGFLFFLPEIRVTCRACVRVWEGDTEQERSDGKGEEMVFLTEHGEVYHTSSSCSHLNVSISAAGKEKIETLRNETGEKYHACEKCVGDGVVGELLYVTASGNRYHNSLTCSGLKRSISLVKKSEAAGYPPCSSCSYAEKGAA